LRIRTTSDRMEPQETTRMSPHSTSKLGATIRRYREKASLSQRALARQAGLSHTTVIRIEGGEFGRPDPEKLARLADALEIDAEELYALAPYPDLPEMAPYLRTKYGMSDEAVAEAEAFFAELERRDKREGRRGKRAR